MPPFFAYMLECNDGSFYVGHTDDLEARIAQHESGAFGGHTAARRPVRLVWSAELDSRDEAFALERQLKGWSRAKKKALIGGDWSALKALARGPNRSDRLGRRKQPARSPFDSGPAGGRPYAQGERGVALSGIENGGPRSSAPVHPDAHENPSARPERSGRAAAAESKGETSRRG